METMTNELTVIPRTIGMMGGMGMLKPEFIEDAAVSYTHLNISIPELLSCCFPSLFSPQEIQIIQNKYMEFEKKEDFTIWFDQNYDAILQDYINKEFQGSSLSFNEYIRNELERSGICLLYTSFVFEKRLIVSTLKQHGISSVLTTPENLSGDVINKYLEMKARSQI